MAAPLLPGDPRQLGSYWLAWRLGAGAQGVVYEAYDSVGGRVAVKALHGDFVTDAYRDQLRREVEALGRVAAYCTTVATTMRSVDPATAKQLAVVAASLAPDGPEARNALVTLYGQPEYDDYRPAGVDGNWEWDQDRTGHVAVAAHSLGHEMKIVDVDARKVTRTITLTGTPIAESGATRIVSLTDDGKAVSVIRKDGTVGIWDTATGRPWPVTFHVPEPYAVLNPTGTRLLSVGWNPDKVKVWDTATGKPVLEIPHLFVPGESTAVFTPDGTHLIRAHGTSVESWDLDTGKKAPRPLLKLRKGKIFDLRVSPDGRHLAVRPRGDQLAVIDLDEIDGEHGIEVGTYAPGAVWRTIPSGALGRLGFSSDGRYVNMGSTVWNADGFQGEPVFAYTSDHCANGNFTFGPGDRTLRCVYEAATVLSLGTLRDPAQLIPTDVDTAVTSADGSTLAIQDYAGHGLEIWDPVNGSNGENCRSFPRTTTARRRTATGGPSSLPRTKRHRRRDGQKTGRARHRVAEAQGAQLEDLHPGAPVPPDLLTHRTDELFVVVTAVHHERGETRQRQRGRAARVCGRGESRHRCLFRPRRSSPSALLSSAAAVHGAGLGDAAGHPQHEVVEAPAGRLLRAIGHSVTSDDSS